MPLPHAAVMLAMLLHLKSTVCHMKRVIWFFLFTCELTGTDPEGFTPGERKQVERSSRILISVGGKRDEVMVMMEIAETARGHK